MSPGAQNMGPDTLCTAENESESVKHENGTRRSRYYLKRVRERSPSAQDMKTGPDALGIAENESGSAKHEKGTLRPRYRRKRVWDRKT
jgi:hypothetical protein